jgi:hypothetical protein
MISKNQHNFFKIGNVIKVIYVVLLKKKKKFYSIVGLCFNKNNYNFKIVNIIKREKIIMRFNISAPLIVKIFVITLYKRYVFRLSRLYFKSNKVFKDDLTNKKNFINSSLYSFKIDFFWGAYLKKRKRTRIMKKKRHKKIKRKYFNTEN